MSTDLGELETHRQKDPSPALWDSYNEVCATTSWSVLPAVPLTIIFSHLDDESRASAAQVCSTWYSVFCTASLWRKRNYRFGGFRSNQQQIGSMMGYARKFGNHLRCLHLLCDHPTFVTCKQLQRGLGSFFNVLMWKGTKLFHFQFNNLHSDRYWRYDFIRQRLVSSICRFLRNQGDINCFEMDRATLPLLQGVRLIENLTHSTGRYISAVNIEDFFAPRTALYCSSRFQSCMSRFQNLTMLQTNYNYLSEKILRTLCQNCKATFIFISIKVYRFDPHVHRIDSLTWNDCKKLCPHLTVRVSFEGIGEYYDIISILTSGMPLTNLNIWTGLRHTGDDWRTNDMLQYITQQFGKQIEDISLSLETGDELIDECLLKLLESAPNLEYLEVQAPVLVPTLQAICKMQEQYRIGLQKCHITTEKFTAQEIEEMAAVEREYEVMIYERGLDFIFTATDFAYY